MAQLSDETKREGRALVAAGNIDALMPWVREHSPVGLDHKVYEKTMRLCFLAQDSAKAMKLHNVVFDTYDQDHERAVVAAKRMIIVGMVVVSLVSLSFVALLIVALVKYLMN